MLAPNARKPARCACCRADRERARAPEPAAGATAAAGENACCTSPEYILHECISLRLLGRCTRTLAGDQLFRVTPQAATLRGSLAVDNTLAFTQMPKVGSRNPRSSLAALVFKRNVRPLAASGPSVARELPRRQSRGVFQQSRGQGRVVPGRTEPWYSGCGSEAEARRTALFPPVFCSTSCASATGLTWQSTGRPKGRRLPLR